MNYRFWCAVNAFDCIWIAFKKRNNPRVRNSYFITGIRLFGDVLRLI